MRIVLSLILILALASVAAAQAKVDHSAFDAILQKHVRNGGVDYLAIRKSDFGNLVGYLDAMEKVDHTSLPYAERLAMYCNLYNATMIRVVVERFKFNYSVAENDKRIFKQPLVRMKEGITTLNYLEHELIRKGFPGEYRVHASLVCAGLGCPTIAPRALRADQLDAMLNDDMHRWVNDPGRNVIDTNANTATLSKLFKFYADDFGGIDKVVGILDQYSDADLSRMRVTYSDDYDWALNVAAPASGRWVKVTSDYARVRTPGEDEDEMIVLQSAVLEVLSEGHGTLKVDQTTTRGTKIMWISADDVAPYVAADHKWQPEKKQ